MASPTPRRSTEWLGTNATAEHSCMSLLDESADVGIWLGSLAWFPTMPARIDPASQQRPHTTVPDPPPMRGQSNSLAGVSVGRLADSRSASLPADGLEPLKPTEHKPAQGALSLARSPPRGSSRAGTLGQRLLTSVPIPFRPHRGLCRRSTPPGCPASG